MSPLRFGLLVLYPVGLLPVAVAVFAHVGGMSPGWTFLLSALVAVLATVAIWAMVSKWNSDYDPDVVSVEQDGASRGA